MGFLFIDYILTNRALNMYYVYFLQNSSGKIYIGYTNNLERRLGEQTGRKMELIYYEAYKNKFDATERESRLKQRGQSIRWLRERIKRSSKLSAR